MHQLPRQLRFAGPAAKPTSAVPVLGSPRAAGGDRGRRAGQADADRRPRAIVHRLVLRQHRHGRVVIVNALGGEDWGRSHSTGGINAVVQARPSTPRMSSSRVQLMGYIANSCSILVMEAIA